jgi:hypothetical protein
MNSSQLIFFLKNAYEEDISYKEIENFSEHEIQVRSNSGVKRFDHCTFRGIVKFSRLKVNTRLFFINCIFLGEHEEFGSFYSSEGNGNHLTFRNCTFFGDVIFKSDNYSALNLDGNDFNGELTFNGSSITRIAINQSAKEKKSIISALSLINFNATEVFSIRDSEVKKYMNFQFQLPSQVFIGQGKYEVINFENTTNLNE